MHIEPGYLSASKILYASIAAAGVLGVHTTALLKQPALWLRTALAAVFFSLFMQAFHMKAGPSELHFVGAMPVYLAFGYLPTLFGFAAGLLMQGLLFEPQDLVHLSVNTLSLVVPLMAVHHGIGKRIAACRWVDILKLDGAYYAGVTLMVGFWLSVGEVATPLAGWLRFAASYVPLVIFEPAVTLGVLALVQRARRTRAGAICFAAATR